MPHMRPCISCPHREIDGAPCPIKTEKLDIIRKAKLTLVNFQCPKRLSELQPGQRVRLRMRGLRPCAYSDPFIGSEMDEFQGTVMRPHKTRVLVWLDELSPMGRNPVALRPNGLVPIAGEKLVKICPDCFQPVGTKARKWNCWGSNRECLNRENGPREYVPED